MKRSEINAAYSAARRCFERHSWVLPPNPRWDITDFGQGDFARQGLVLVNLADEPEYAEKIMYAVRDQITPSHTHRKKKEDIICRAGVLRVWLWPSCGASPQQSGRPMQIRVNGKEISFVSGEPVSLPAGHRITITPGLWHTFAPSSAECVIGEVSTANDDVTDNVFLTEDIGRFPAIEEDEAPLVRLVSETTPRKD